MKIVSTCYRKNVNIQCWNVEGIQYREGRKSISKLSVRDFLHNFIKCDIVCLLETKVGPGNKLKVDGFNEYMICRKRSKRATHDSGGLVIFVKEQLCKGVTILPTKSTEHGWVKLQSQFFGFTCDLYICFAYINPENSTYVSDIDVIDSIKQEAAVYKNMGRCMLMVILALFQIVTVLMILMTIFILYHCQTITYLIVNC